MTRTYHDRMLRPAATGIHCPHCRAVAAQYDRGSAAGVRRSGFRGCVRIHQGRTVVMCGVCGKDFDPHERKGA
jgi:transcription elongation factor Elf1